MTHLNMRHFAASQSITQLSSSLIRNLNVKMRFHTVFAAATTLLAVFVGGALATKKVCHTVDGVLICNESGPITVSSAPPHAND